MNQKQQQEYYCPLKLVLVGPSGAGKTSLLTRLIDDIFQPNNLASIGVDYRIKTTTIDGQGVKSQIWDTAGPENQRSLIYSLACKGASGIFLTFDTTSEESFCNVQKIMESLKGIVDDDVPKVLVGCKTDLEEQRSVVFDVAKALANNFGLTYIETSAKTGYNCSTAHDTLSKLALSYLYNKNTNMGPKFNKMMDGKNCQKVGKCW